MKRSTWIWILVSRETAESELTGVWYPAGSSRRRPARLITRGTGYRVVVEGQPERSGLLNDLVVSKRVGDIPRGLRLADQSLFETTDNDLVDGWIGQSSMVSGSGVLHQLETRWSWIVISLICTVLLVYAGGRYGLPWASEKVAQALPDNVVRYVSTGSLDLLDRLFLKPSKLNENRQQALRDQFRGDFGNSYRLHFRRLGVANAFALPDGQIVVTDRFTRLANKAEFNAVILHEIGHIEQRHGMQQLVQSSIVAFVVAMMVGDPSGLEEVVVGLPVFLMQSHYSRKHESSADEYAFEEMMRRGIDPINFATIMEKMESEAAITVGGDSAKDGDKGNDQKDNGEMDQDFDADEDVSTSYLSTHPATRERIENARRMSARFNDEED